MASPYNVYLVDITNRIGSDDRRNEIKAVLQSYFDPIAKKVGIKEGAKVSFVTDNPQAKPNELIAYYSSSGWHVVTEMPGAKVPADAEGGLTLWNGTVTGSDVVADPDTATRTIANLTFHELMHNKLNMGDEMHRLGGLASSSVDDTMRPSPKNIEMMSSALLKQRPQWTGGFAQLKERGKPIHP
jgi:hypothetical protein